jgi:hypothetical protein
LAKAAFMVIANAVLRMIAAETMIFPIVFMDFSFLIGWPRQSQRADTAAPEDAPAQFPNTDPGLAGETGVSGDCGSVYDSDGLNVGDGIAGASFKTGGWNPWLMWPP